MRNLILVVVASFLTILSSSVSLTADDHFSPLSPNYDGANQLVAKTIHDPVEEEKADKKAEITSEIDKNAVVTASYVARANTAVAPAAPAAGVATPVNYTVTHVISTPRQYNEISVNPSYADIYRYNRLIFAHNTANLLGNLSSLVPGQVITITEGGQAQTYRVASVTTYAKTGSTINNDPAFINKITANAFGHARAMMTCAGVAYGNGDASHRIVVLLDAV